MISARMIDYVTQKDEYDTKIAKCSATMKSFRSDLWQLFENLLGLDLIPKWQEIVHKETTTDGFIAKGGIRMPRKRGHSNNALEACIHTWSLLVIVMQTNTAERHCMHVQV